MNKIFLKLNSDKLTKLKETSEYFKGLKSYSQSDYWRLHESLSAYKFKTDGVYIQGESGHYYPRERNLYNIIRTGLGRRSHSVARNACCKILCSVRFDQKISRSPKISFPYHDAYDAMWSVSPFVDYSENIERLDFRKVQIPKEFKNHKSLLRHWHLKDRFLLNSKFFFDFYNYFVVHHFSPNPSRILEIGGGNGNLASIFHYYSKSHITLVDIPSTLFAAIVFLSHIFPDAEMMYPQDLSQDRDLNGYNFCFCLPDQTNILRSNSYDVAINNSSFQEMTSEQIQEYFNLIYRVLQDGGIYSTVNRVEKCPSKENKPIRFSEYPYSFPHQVLLNEVERFMRLVQRDNCIHKIVRIVK